MRFIEKLLRAFMRFMNGRYARFDQLNLLILIVYLILGIINMFTNLWVLQLVMGLLVVIFVFRLLSKNITARQKENNAVVKFFAPLHVNEHFFKFSQTVRSMFGARKRPKYDPNYVYFGCPNCSGNLRVPRGLGEINVTCPRCKTQFRKKT